MKGAMALLSAKTIRALTKPSIMTIGNSQYRFRTFKNSQNSLMIDWLAIFKP